MELDGKWQISPGTSNANFSETNTLEGRPRQRQWAEVELPNNWASIPALAGLAGPVTYRREFINERTEIDEIFGDDARRWLQFDGIFYQSYVTLNSTLLGDTEGYYVPRAFEITELVSNSNQRNEHELLIEVSAPATSTHQKQNAVIGSFVDFVRSGDSLGGIWRSPQLLVTGPVRINSLRVTCVRANAGAATLELSGELESKVSQTIEILTELEDYEVTNSVHRQLVAGTNRVSWKVMVNKPLLWWPAELGNQPLTELKVSLVVDGKTSDSRTRVTGLRDVKSNQNVFAINGERIQLRGLSAYPFSPQLAQTDRELVRRRFSDLRHANLNSIRLLGHIAHPLVYEAADEMGILIWQDMPLHFGYSRRIRTIAERHAKAAVDVYGHHPSIVCWCTHSEPRNEALEQYTTVQSKRSLLKLRKSDIIPSFNRSILDESIKRTLRSADRSRPVVASAGGLPTPVASFGATSISLRHQSDIPGSKSSFFNSSRLNVLLTKDSGKPQSKSPNGVTTALQNLAMRWPRAVTLVSEIDIDKTEVASNSKAAIERVTDAICVLRTIKYRPNAAFFISSDIATPTDLAPVLEPLQIYIDQPRDFYGQNEDVDLRIYVISEIRKPILDAIVRVTIEESTNPQEAVGSREANRSQEAVSSHRISDPHEIRTTQGIGQSQVIKTSQKLSWLGDIKSDDITYVGRIHIETPKFASSFAIKAILTTEGTAISTTEGTAISASRAFKVR